MKYPKRAAKRTRQLFISCALVPWPFGSRRGGATALLCCLKNATQQNAVNERGRIKKNASDK